MLKKLAFQILIFLIAFIVNFSFSSKLYASLSKDRKISFILEEFDKLSGDQYSNQDIAFYFDSGVKDRRIAVLKSFFRKHNSPLYEHADFIVKISDKYELDYRLIPAIAMQESTACKFIPQNSYNCWGWGIYGDKVTRFESYPDAIDTIARGLKIYYIDRGLKTPEEIMAKYTPSSKGSWANGVSSVLGVLE
ncbi:hypothetical protein COY14_01075 [Candidatus Roizmanbacteria bacterium CG_4_10_14_0_2_um_filter_36_9]|uniref:Mannosyl-glycoprotein endo-beta-N-acetylglucosamidase-like domain-containing protein n=1 Tax=Candidatus Roizmanbacteria bacterium CG_4_10_14_0_2_um_filter_36_9 TaxID=1974823 RepID=A0A2M7U594_9BACT|nr:MAG: hypothetical protein COY14_01075 [Candidatus Roizmanbacteria bacterium CG_4_10_14_0_2_um_filter_36_9]